MDKYLRWFIKYQMYLIIVVTMTMVVMFTPIMADHEAQEIENLRFGGYVALLFGITWAAAVICLVIAIKKEDKRFIYPYAAVLVLDLSLLILRELYRAIFDNIHIHIVGIAIFIGAITLPYVCASLFALHRLFTVDPIVIQQSAGFVRFDRNEVTGVRQDRPTATSSPVSQVMVME
ncbi:uncharacterized protein LOC128726871 [Anopheles nili]|uniref:uncharacterized protein LOC128726871 n=1 Tax=Anopheles nili TaxID=185578 RepID=UPI00237BC953|nr:uncharacterized protein LOC128726871 [Anopheles nili]